MYNIEEIEKEIEAEFSKFTRTEFIKRKHKLISCFENLYKSFKDNPFSKLKTNDFLGEESLSQNLKTRKTKQKNADTYCNRINYECLKPYTGMMNPKIEFWVKKYQETDNEYQEKISFFRLDVEYDKKNYRDIVSKRKSDKPITDDTILDLEEAHSLSEMNYSLVEYLKQIEQDHQYLDTKYFGALLLNDNAVKLDKIFIKLKVTKDISISQATHLTEQTGWLSGLSEKGFNEKKMIWKESSPAISVDQFLNKTLKEKDELRHHMVILGAPGSGKTTLLKYLAYSFASGKAEEWGFRGFIPIYINLSEFAFSDETDLLQYILAKETDGILENSLRDRLEKALKYKINECKTDNKRNGRIVFLLDALDETWDEKRKVVTAIERMRNRYNKAFIIVTSRIVNYYEATLQNFKHYIVDDLQLKSINNFIETWFQILAENKSLEKSEKDLIEWSNNRANNLIRQIKKKPNLKRIATSPLYLSFLVFLFSDPETEVPETRSFLYRKYFNKLILNWEKKHGLPFSYDELYEGFIEICWVIHRAFYGGLKKDPTIDYIKNSIRDSISLNLDLLIEFWINSGVFLIVKTKHQNELILPRHLSFLEYGFACKLASLWNDEKKREDLWKDLKPNLHNEYLFEPLLLFVSIVEDPNSFLKMIWDIKDDLFYNNIIFLCHAAHYVKTKIHHQTYFKNLLLKVFELCGSKNTFIHQIRYRLIEGLGLVGDMDKLTDLLKTETDYYARLHILETIANIGDKTAISFFKKTYELERSNDTRKNLVWLIKQIGDKTTIPILKQFIEKATDPMLRSVISISIYKLGDTKLAMSYLKKIYEKELSYETDPMVRSGIIRSIAYEIGKNAIPLFEKFIEMEDDSEIRSRIIYSIYEIGDNNVISLLQTFFEKDTFPSVRLSIVNVISKIGDKNAILLLQTFFEKETNSLVKLNIAEQLYQLGGEIDIRILKQLFKNETDSYLKFKVAKIMGKLDGQNAIPFLENFFEEETDSWIRSNIAGLIGEVGNKRLALSLLDKLFKKERYSKHKPYIAKLIGEMGNKKLAIALLDKLFKEESEEWVRKRIVEHIGSLGEKTEIPILKRFLGMETSPINRIDIFQEISHLGGKNGVSFLAKCFEKETDSLIRWYIAAFIGNAGNKQLAISLFKRLFDNEADHVWRSKIVKEINYMGDKNSILLLKQLLEMETNPSVRIDLIESIFSFSKKEKILIFEDKKGQFEFVEIPERYSF